MAKISEIRGTDTIDLFAEIIEPVANIATDPAMADVFKVEAVDEDADTRELAKQRLIKHVPKLIKTHKNDVVAILAAINSTPVDEYEKSLNVATLLRDVYDVVTDEELVGFFTSLTPSVTNDEQTSGDTSTTGDQQLTLA